MRNENYLAVPPLSLYLKLTTGTAKFQHKCDRGNGNVAVLCEPKFRLAVRYNDN